MEKINYKKLEEKKNKVKFEAVVPEDLFEKRRSELFKQMSKSVKIPGFRPGMAPKAEIEKQIAYNVYIETINKVLPEVAIEVLKLEKLNPISTLNYDIPEVDKNEKGIKFTFEFLRQPDIDVSKLTKLKVEKKEEKVTDEEVIEVIKNLVKSSLPREKWEKNIVKTEKKASKDSNKEESEQEDIELTDDLIKELGYEDEKDLAGAKAKVKETLISLKEEQSQGEYTNSLVMAAVNAADFEVPHEYVHKEMEEREEQFKKRLKDLKLDAEVYLKTQGKTIEELREEWHKQSELDLATDLLLINLAVKEKRIPTDEEVEQEISKLDDASKKYYSVESNREYLKTALTRNNGLKRLVELNEKSK